MERTIFNSYESRYKTSFDIFTSGAWWLRSTCNTYPPCITESKYFQFYTYTGYVSVISYICYDTPDHYYYITPVCSI